MNKFYEFSVFKAPSAACRHSSLLAAPSDPPLSVQRVPCRESHSLHARACVARKLDPALHIKPPVHPRLFN